MSEKSQIIEYLKNTFAAGSVNSSNTSYSNINKSKQVWWFNVSVHKFDAPVNLLFKEDEEIIWVQLPKDFVPNLESKFKVRQDKDAVDLEISADRSYLYLKDVKSGGTYFDFKPYVKERFKF
ncbi:hypothetical protein [Salegentibacter flavus]|uniref:Uncharacterized protein n=1 Tax=Salegentibacter flavus TaxID=287099 RepID=A0A1I4ZTZ8_9FLAO|nr:hypothetical protein [Salegentibacter flavus]SFN53714.1 hypothetical protein SAMN05660413_01521 [Salegentibacter flavus]